MVGKATAVVSGLEPGRDEACFASALQTFNEIY